MNGYKRDIMEATGANEQELALVEGLMREENRGLLDDLTERQFDAQARVAYEVAQALLADPEHADVVAYYRERGA